MDEKERAILRLGCRAEDGTERLGSPVLFGSSYFGALCSLPEGKGGGVVIRQHPESVQAVYAARQEELEDADTAEDEPAEAGAEDALEPDNTAEDDTIEDEPDAESQETEDQPEEVPLDLGLAFPVPGQ